MSEKLSSPYVFAIAPVPKPRMTRADAWKGRSCVERYWKYKNELSEIAKELKFDRTILYNFFHITFNIPMPATWSKKKKEMFVRSPHLSKPDTDNLIKAFLDCLLLEDSTVYDYRVTKLWDYEGKITVGK